MRTLVLLLAFVAAMHPGRTAAQALNSAASSSAPLSTQASQLLSESIASRQSLPLTAPRRIHYCCNLKHALIGAGIGVAVGLFYAGMCETPGCRVTIVAGLGGIGAGLGAFVSAHPRVPPLSPVASP